MPTIPLPKILANFETSLAAKMSEVATTFTLDISTDGDGSTLSGLYQLTLDEGSTNEEHLYATLAGATGTVTRRGLSRVDAWTEVTANKQIHDRGATVKVTDLTLILINRLLNGDDTFNAVNWTGVNSVSGLATPTAGELTKAASVAYVNAAAIAGASDASEVGKGIVEIATQTETNEGDDSGSTTAPAVVTPSKLLQTRDAGVTTDFTYGATLAALAPVYVDSTASNKLKLALATGASTADTFAGITIDAGVDTNTNLRVQISGVVTGLSGLTSGALVFLTNIGGFSTTPGTYRFPIGWAISATSLAMFPAPTRRPLDLAGANAAATVANFNEAMTFFDATDITGAEAETLSSGTLDADALHIHASIPSYSENIENIYSATLGRFQFTVNPAQTFGYLAVRFSSDGFIIRRFTIDPLTKLFIRDGVTATVTGSPAFSDITSVGIVATSSFVYAVGAGSSNIVLIRLPTDLSTQTQFTISGTAYTTPDIISACGDDSNLYLKTNTATQLLVYALSGTTATRGTDITLTSAVSGVTGFDGTKFYNFESSGGIIRKYAIGGGSPESSTTRFFASEGNQLGVNSVEVTTNGAVGIVPIGRFLLCVGAAAVNETTNDRIFIRFYKISKP